MARMTNEFQFSDASATMHRQFGALCWRRRDGGVQVLLVTSRETGRWVIPKGWPMAKLTGPETAAREAFEEAGVEGRIAEAPLGSYGYGKVMDRDSPAQAALACDVSVYPLQVMKTRDRYPEADQRKRKWFGLTKAAALVEEPGLRDIILGFTPAATPVTP